MLLKYLLWGIIIYYLYKFVFGVIIPVGKAANQMKSKVKEMQDAQMRQQQQAEQQKAPPQAKQPTNVASKDDYIEFEEIK